MRLFFLSMGLVFLLSCKPQARERINLSEDDASHSAYSSGWQEGKNAGTGFHGWHFETTGSGRPDSHAGNYMANRDSGSGHRGLGDRAFALYANGVHFEAAVAFRNMDEPLSVGDSFSLLMKSGDFSPKFSGDDERPGWVGFALRSGTAGGRWEDGNQGARFEFGASQGRPNYQVRDGGTDSDTGVPVNDTGVAVTVTLVSPDVYDLEITALDTRITKKITNRRLGGSKGSPIESFALINQDGEKGDAYFNGFQVSRLLEKTPR